MLSSKKLMLLSLIVTALALPGCGKKCVKHHGPKSKTELSKSKKSVKKHEKKSKKSKKSRSKKEDRSKKGFFSK